MGKGRKKSKERNETSERDERKARMMAPDVSERLKAAADGRRGRRKRKHSSFRFKQQLKRDQKHSQVCARDEGKNGEKVLLWLSLLSQRKPSRIFSQSHGCNTKSTVTALKLKLGIRTAEKETAGNDLSSSLPVPGRGNHQ